MRRPKEQRLAEDAAAAATADMLAPLPADQESIADGLNPQQRTILQLKLRNFSQEQISSIMKLTPARISQQVAAIRKHYEERGSKVDQAVIIGESLTVFEDVEKEAWKLHGDLEGAQKLKALDRVMHAREKHVQLLMDVGLVKKAATVTQHELTVSPAIRELSQEKRQIVVNTLLELPAGEEPTPPIEGELED